MKVLLITLSVTCAIALFVSGMTAGITGWVPQNPDAYFGTLVGGGLAAPAFLLIRWAATETNGFR